MRLYFLRHAQAEDRSGAKADHDRELTKRGIVRTKTAAQVMKKLGLSPRKIYSSPRIRARQTAEIVAEALEIEVEIRDEVDADFDVAAARQLIKDLKGSDEVMFVGHEPSFSYVVGQLCGGDVVMKKGGLARVDVESTAAPLRGDLVFLITPKVFDTLAGQ